MIYLIIIALAAVMAGSSYECKDPDCKISTIPRENDGRRNN